MKDNSFISVAVVNSAIKYNDIKNIGDWCESRYDDYEIVMVGQVADAPQILNTVPSVRYLEYRGEMNTDNKRITAIENCIGDYIIFFNPHQEPMDVIADITARAKEGSDIVFGLDKRTNKQFYRLSRRMCSLFLPLIGQIRPGTTDLVCLTRNAINAMLTVARASWPFRINIIKTAIPIDYLEYSVHNPSAVHKSTIDGLKRAFQAMVMTSTTPLRLISALGFAAGFGALCFSLYTFLVRFFVSHIVEGWTSTMLVISFLFMLMFVILGFIVEYMGRLLADIEAKENFVMREKTSRVMINKDRLNVLNDSEDK